MEARAERLIDRSYEPYAPYELDNGITEFESLLTQVPVKSLSVEVDINNPSPVLDAKTKFFAQDYQLETTMYVSKEFDALAGGIVGFETLVASEEVASYHGVFFGDIHLEDGTTVSVAVKPHTVIEGDSSSRKDAESSCFNDFYNNVCAQPTCLGGLKPVGFLMGREGSLYSMTLLDEGLSTFDSIDWTVFYREGEETSGMRELWDKAAISIATVHGEGASRHGDVAARNIGTSPSGQVFLFDWEAGAITKSPPKDVEARFGYSLVDLRKLVEDMATPNTLPFKPGIGLFTYAKESWWESFNELFFEQYEAWRIDYAKQGSHHMSKLRETTEELAQLRGTLHQIINDLEVKYRVEYPAIPNN